MIEKIEKVNDLKIVISELLDIQSLFNSEKYDRLELSESLLAVSKPIIQSGKVNNDEISEYTLLSKQLFTNLGLNGKFGKTDFYNWIILIRKLIAKIFVLMTLEDKDCTYLFDDSDEIFLEFFDTDEYLIVLAHYYASRRYARRNPMMCYRNTMKDFEKYPALLSDFFNNLNYQYRKEDNQDIIYDKCPICGCDESEPFFCAEQAITDRAMFSPSKLWMKCKKCTNLYAYNFPVMKMGDINGHYTCNNTNGLLDIRNPLHIYCNIFNNIRQYNTGNKYLEVGVGNGEMLAVALEMGYDVSAVEICKSDCENISGILNVDIVWNDFLKYNTDRKFDIIIMGDILEHVSEPVLAIKKAYELLDDDGILWLSTPNYESAFSRMRKFTDPMWNQPNHFTYFSYRGLEPLLLKSGFEIKRYEVSNRYNGSMELYLQKK